MHEERSDDSVEVCVIATSDGEWIRRFPRTDISWSEDALCPVQTPADHAKLVLVCERAEDRAPANRQYFQTWRRRVAVTLFSSSR